MLRLRADFPPWALTVIIAASVSHIAIAEDQDYAAKADGTKNQCNVNTSGDTVDVTTELSDGTPVLSKVFVGSDYSGITDGSGRCRMLVDPCGSAQEVTIRPTFKGYCEDFSRCSSSIHFPVRECSFYAQLSEGNMGGLPWASVMLSVFNSEIETIGGYGEPLAQAYDDREFGKALAIAHEALLEARTYEDTEGVNAASVVELDAAFRALGFEPASPNSQLMGLLEDGTVFVSELGQEILSYTNSGEGDLTAPVILPDETLEFIASVSDQRRAMRDAQSMRGVLQFYVEFGDAVFQ